MMSALLAAAAASSLTAFGIIDVDQHGRGGGLAANRIGLRGEAGVASFWLETGFVPGTGKLNDPERIFSRRATVSLFSKQYGELRLGRDFSPGFMGYSFYDAFGASGIGAVNRFIPTGFQDGQISYIAPASADGWQWQLSAAPAANMSAVRVRYIIEGFDAGLALQRQPGVTLATGGISRTFGDVRLIGAFGHGGGKPAALEAGVQWRGWRAAFIRAGTNHVSLGYVHEVTAATAVYATVIGGGEVQVGVRQAF
jgi:predicted porin